MPTATAARILALSAKVICRLYRSIKKINKIIIRQRRLRLKIEDRAYIEVYT